MRIFSSLVAIAVLFIALPAQAWGPIGHRVSGKIAQDYLSPQAQAGIASLMGVETLAEGSTWPDFMRSNPSDFWRRTASPWHYVTVPPGMTYAQAGAPEEGDAYTALNYFRGQIRDPNVPVAQRQLALRFVVHIIADLHQPLHVGNGKDRGGNRVNVLFMDKPTNLHAMWDEDLITHQQLSYTEMAHWLNRRITPEMQAQWSQTDAKIWIAESAALRERVYEILGPADRDTMPNLSYNYFYAHKADVDQRLQQSGVRIAAYLNELFAE
jgi:hypothetical protein